MNCDLRLLLTQANSHISLSFTECSVIKSVMEMAVGTETLCLGCKAVHAQFEFVRVYTLSLLVRHIDCGILMALRGDTVRKQTHHMHTQQGLTSFLPVFRAFLL